VYACSAVRPITGSRLEVAFQTLQRPIFGGTRRPPCKVSVFNLEIKSNSGFNRLDQPCLLCMHARLSVHLPVRARRPHPGSSAAGFLVCVLGLG
jgi:hypothetical protein